MHSEKLKRGRDVKNTAKAQADSCLLETKKDREMSMMSMMSMMSTQLHLQCFNSPAAGTLSGRN